MLKGASGQQQRLRQAWRIGPNLGSLDNLRRVSEAIDPPAPGQAQIAIKSIGLNFAGVGEWCVQGASRGGWQGRRRPPSAPPAACACMR